MPSPFVQGSARQVARVYAALPAAGAWDATPLEFSCLACDRLTLFIEYIQGAAGGSVDVQVQYSPYAIDAEVPAGQTEWFSMSAYAVGVVAGGADTTSLIQANFMQFDPVGAALEGLVLSVDLEGGPLRFRVRARESGVVGTPGSCGVTIMLSRLGGTRYD